MRHRVAKSQVKSKHIAPLPSACAPQHIMPRARLSCALCSVMLASGSPHVRRAHRSGPPRSPPAGRVRSWPGRAPGAVAARRHRGAAARGLAAHASGARATAITHLAVPAIDVHTHLRRVVDVPAESRAWTRFTSRPSSTSMASRGKRLVRELERFDRAYPGRFLTFANLDLTLVGAPGWGERVAAQLATGFEAGAKGSRSSRSSGSRCARRRAGASRSTARSSSRSGARAPALPPARALARGRPAAFFVPLDAKNAALARAARVPELVVRVDRTRFPYARAALRGAQPRPRTPPRRHLPWART